jgi:hypothetical protein
VSSSSSKLLADFAFAFNTSLPIVRFIHPVIHFS